MAKPTTVWTTNVVIVTEYDPSDVQLDHLAREACDGDAICTSMVSQPVPFSDVAGSVGDFFDGFDDDDA